MQTNSDGDFSIANIRTGAYNLYAWVPNFIGDYKYQDAIVVVQGNIYVHVNIFNIEIGCLKRDKSCDDCLFKLIE